MSYRAPLHGLGQTKPTGTSTDHTATDWATALTTAGALAVPIVTAATGQQQATTTTPAATLQAQAIPAPSTDWYWPVMGIVGVLTVGGIIYMVTKKPKTGAAKAAPAKAATPNRRRSRKNGWRRRASRAWKGKRRSRAKRAS